MKLDILDVMDIILPPFNERVDWNTELESASNNALFK